MRWQMLTKETIKGMKKEELIALVRADKNRLVIADKNRLVIADKNRLEELVELVIADQNRLEYLLDKKVAQERDIERYKRGLEELQRSTEILLMKVAIEKGAEVNGGKELWLPRKTDLDGYEVQTKLDEAGERIGIILTKKE